MGERFLRRFCGFGLCLATAFLGAIAGQAQVSHGSIEDEAVLLGREALENGDLVAADQMAAAALAMSPTDAEALILRSLLLRRAGRFSAAAQVSADAWRYAETGNTKFDAALLTANNLADQERYTRAQFWLRRARQAAPDPVRRARTEDAYRLVERENPLNARLRFSLSPSNNVNNGSETLEIEIGGLPFELDAAERQLSGLEASLGTSLSYRLAESDLSRTYVLGSLSFRRIWLDDEVEEVAPELRNSDFDFGAITVGARHDRVIWPDLGPTTITATLGQSWYGGEPTARWADLALGQTVEAGVTSVFRYGLNARFEKRLDNPLNDSETLGVSMEYLRRLGPGTSYSLGIWVRDQSSESATIDSLTTGVSASRTFERLGPVEPRIRAGASSRDFRKWSVTEDGRVDRSLDLQIDALWPDLEYFGFAPETTITVRRTWSNIDIYDRNEISIGFNIVSNF